MTGDVTNGEAATGQDSTAMEDSPSVKDIITGKGTPAAEKTPVKESDSLVEKTPVKGVVEKTPVKEIDLLVGKTPVKEVDPLVEKSPVKEVNILVGKTPVKEVNPLVVKTPVKGDNTLVEMTPVKEADTLVGKIPVKEVDPLIEKTPVKEVDSLVEMTPVEEVYPIVEKTPVKEVIIDPSTVKEVTELDKKIIRQIEYYFGDYNLPRDKFLTEEIKKDDGWVALETMFKFKRLASLSTDAALILAALRKSTSRLIEINEGNDKIRRAPTHPLPIYNDEIKEETTKRTIYCKGFPKDGSLTLDDLLEYFKEFGPYETVLMRYFFERTQEKKQGFKGSVLVVFPSVEKAQEFFDRSEVKFKETVLIRKWHTDYIAEKRKEMEERKAKRAAKDKKKENGGEEKKVPVFQPLPKGTLLFASGFPDNTSREDIRKSFLEFTEDLAFVDFSAGSKEGYLRFKTENCNKNLLEKLDCKIKMGVTEVSLRIVEGDEEEEQLKKANEALARGFNNKNAGHGKRKGGFVHGRGGHYNKKRRNN